MNKREYQKHLSEKGYKMLDDNRVEYGGNIFVIVDSGEEKEPCKGVKVGRFCLRLEAGVLK